MTAHIKAKKEDIAKTVIMPGDPLRAKFIAETYLDDYKLVNEVRNILAYTGYYKGNKVTVMASGMGNPSMGIYSYELFKFYDVDNIIRVGSCGAYTDKLNLYDLILVEESYSKSTYALMQNGCESNVMYSSTELNNKIISKNNNIIKGKVYCSDVFYKDNDDFKELYANDNCLAVEMETFALFHNANVLSKNATAILTVSDNLVTNEVTSSEEREKSFTQMMELALSILE
jgi:purine-nucleoside phosphorylase